MSNTFIHVLVTIIKIPVFLFLIFGFFYAVIRPMQRFFDDEENHFKAARGLGEKFTWLVLFSLEVIIPIVLMIYGASYLSNR